MNEGKKFEHQFHKSLEKEDFYVLRLVDPPSSFGKDSTRVRFSAKNPYDFVAYKSPYLFCLELKSVIGTSVSFQTEEEAKQKKNTSANIKWHQIESLMKADNFDGVEPMFIINFRKTNQTYAIPIAEFIAYTARITKKSINEQDCIKMGILITFANYVAQLKEPLNFMSRAMRSFTDSKNSAERMFEIIDAKPEVVEKDNPLDFSITSCYSS